MAQFWKPGNTRPGSVLDRAGEDELDTGSLAAAAGAARATDNELDSNLLNHGIQAQRDRLPIAKQRNQILYMLERYPVLIVIGQTGCGKTTQIPQFLLEAGWASSSSTLAIACTQPRRISAVSVASRVATEVGAVLGDEVGYTIRFEDLSHPTRTRIRYMTDGMLFRECMRDPLLSRYSVVMIDEAHERGAYTDLLLGVLKKIRRKRPTLRIVISSATVDAQALLDYFNDEPVKPIAQSTDKSATIAEISPDSTAAVLTLEGRTYPVEVAYLEKPVDNYVRAAAEAVWNIHLKEPQGDVLVFLTGRDEIDACCQILADEALTLSPGSPKLLLLPLHAGLTTEEQTIIFQRTPRGSRKVVVATNIAEASVTIDGIRYVVDCGFVKLKLFDPSTGMDALAAVPASLASLTQRAGRAGRTSPGKTLRLFPESALSHLPLTTPPELCRSDLALPLLQLKALGIENVVRNFDWLPPTPPAEMVRRALEFLGALGAVDSWGRLTTPVGERMAEVPLEPMFAKVLLDSATFRCSSEILSIAAMTSVQNPFIIPDEGRSAAGAAGELERRKFTAEEGDHLTLLNVYSAFVNPRVGKSSAKWCARHRLNFKALSRAVSIRAQLEKYLVRWGVDAKVSCEGDVGRLRRCLVSGYFKNAAKMMPDGSYRSVRENAILHVHPSSVLFNRMPSTKWVIFHEVVETTKRFMRDVTVIEEDWLPELAPHFYVVKDLARHY
ncbi:unnamed protein product [Tilletia laevis]|uniref:RNA helicase n=2 Tax=Tilletia TaxID=13289 RepID=A0A177UBS8_9BASI|nr:hypothetical protein CF336_g3396 [Tilletia laevis]KAE8261300.1 hypothetical protein A4X03_0g3379 [Tilletia caries]KAE8204866.1 hypothetical protein CF335_g2504 [Tilletia laevis]CAD6893373.1 unnamed protein product [Tilletia caries]CAD6921390.1 unnamed protein product [Tilletia laevis]